MNMIFQLLSGLLVINIVVIVHEYGHYRSAVKAGVYAPVFAIGFGKTIWTWKKTENTSFELKAIPFGGYVRMASKFEGDELVLPDDAKTLEQVSKIRQIWIIAAGATYNFIFAAILYFIIGLFIGNVTSQVQIDSFDNKYEAHKVLQKGDIIESINDHKVDNPGLLPMYVEKENNIIVKRKNKVLEVNVKGTINPKNKKTYLLGIMQKPVNISHKYGLTQAFNYTFNSFKSAIDMQIATIKMLFSGRAGVSDMSGPIGIIKSTGKVVEQSQGFAEKLVSLLNWMCLISIAIGLANLLLFFIPIVDGGRIFLIILGVILRKDLSESKILDVIMQMFVILMIIYFVYISFIDIFRHV